MKRPLLGIVMLALVWLIFILNTLAFEHYWYWIYEWFDIPMHFLGGFWVGGTIIWILGTFLKRRFASTRGGYLLSVVGLAMVIGLLWELFEFSIDTFITFHMNDIIDTLSDLSMDFLGATVAYVFFSRQKDAATLTPHEESSSVDTPLG